MTIFLKNIEVALFKIKKSKIIGRNFASIRI